MDNKSTTTHQAGFVNIIGKPNVGKSTLMNLLIGEKLSIISPKPQTTRHRIIGIVHGENFQIIYSDTPGVITPCYPLHQSMMSAVSTSLMDADILLWIIDINEHKEEQTTIQKKVQKKDRPLLLVINKIDLINDDQLASIQKYWAETINPTAIICIAALHKTNIEQLLDKIIQYLPQHPPYYPATMLTDKPERFFASEIIREKIFLQYHQEIPYSTEVIITTFTEKKEIIYIYAEIHVERPSQCSILIGHKGSHLKKLGIAARKELEFFFKKKIFLEQKVKISADWRKKNKELIKFGYLSK